MPTGSVWVGVILTFSVKVTNVFVSTEALSRLNVVIQQPNARQSENAMAYDNAVSAVGKICQFHRDSINSSQVACDSYIKVSPARAILYTCS